MENQEKKPKNPFAFPLALSGEHNYAADGMTLRDYFAAEAMQRLSENRLLDYETVSRRAYGIADAMLKQREL